MGFHLCFGYGSIVLASTATQLGEKAAASLPLLLGVAVLREARPRQDVEGGTVPSPGPPAGGCDLGQVWSGLFPVPWIPAERRAAGLCAGAAWGKGRKSGGEERVILSQFVLAR